MPYQRPRRIDEPEDARTYRYLLTINGGVEQTAAWSAWDWIRLSLRCFALATILAAILLGTLEILAPWQSQAIPGPIAR